MIKSATRKIEVFRPGKFVAMNGVECDFTADDLRAIAAAYDPLAAPAPGVIGHPKTDDPAWCWAKGFSYDEAGGRLLAEVGEIEPAFAEAVAEGRYKKISLSLFPPAAASNPKPGQWYPRHIGFLGAAAPAVPGLKPVAFAADADAVTFEFADARAFKDVASLFTSLREWLLEKFGSEIADRTLPRWTIDWIDEASGREPERAFSAPPAKPEDTMPDKIPAGASADDLAARAAALDRREADLRHADNMSFAEGLISEGRLLPVLKDRVVALLDAAGPLTEAVSFAEGDRTVSAQPAALLRDILKAQPKVVDFSTLGADDRAGAPVDFAAPIGARVDAASLDLHRRALAWQVAHPGADYMAAVAAVSA